MVGFPHPLKGEGVYAYIVVKDIADHMTQQEKENLMNELKAMVKNKISGFAVPEMIQVKSDDCANLIFDCFSQWIFNE